MPKSKQPRVVAELGRPETSAETADRKAEQTRKYKMRKTVNNLIFSLLVTVGLVVVIVLAVPRSEEPLTKNIDIVQVAAQTQESVPQHLAVPVLPDTWNSNYAEMRTNSSVRSWQIGFLTPGDRFIGFAQGLSANDTWVSQLLKNTAASDVTTIDGIEWTVYDNRESRADIGNVRYALTAEAGDSRYVLWGTADTTEIETVAKALAPEIKLEADRN